MKKIYIAMAVLATAALASCQQEKSFNDEKIGENDVVFAIKGGATRSAEVAPAARQGVIIPIETESGSQLFLEETVTSLDAFAATRGTPAYTENLGTLYANDLSVWGNGGSFTTAATYSKMDNSLYPRKDANLGDGWRYHRNYAGDPWPDGTVDFYLNMPAAPTGVSITGRDGGKFTFTYTSPTTAKTQQDILFAYRQMTKEQHKGFLPNGAPVLFNHALTAVKFAVGNVEGENVVIKEVIFNNLVDGGTCEITPASESNYMDNKTNYSSAGATEWKNTSVSGTPITSEPYEGTVTYESGENNKFGGSWYSAGNEDNLNDADGTQTFWLVPQAFDANSNVTLTIKYKVNDEEDVWTIDFGKALGEKSVVWKAGELRTYKIRVDDVNVKIEDAVTIGQDQTTTYTDDKGNTHTIYGGTKNGIVITNTGNTDAFMRVAITGQWVDADGAPVFSFTDFTKEDIILDIASWYDDQFGAGTGLFGVFDGLVGYEKNGKDGVGNAGWVKGKDGYYYYTTKVAPGATTSTAPFNSYTVTLANVPKIKVAGALQEVHFVMEVSTQAISAKTLTGGDYNWYDAWNNATGYDPR